MTTNFTEFYDYDYPKDLNLRPDSTLHKKLLDALNDRIRRGYATSANSREMWRKEDHLQTAYVPPDAYSILDLDRDPKAPLDVVIPVSRANLDTMVSYAAGVFFGDPTGMYPLDARSDPVKMIRAAKMERLLDMQGQQFGHKLSHFIGLRDTFLYGISAKTPVWSKHKRREAVIEEVSPILYNLLKGSGVKMSPGDLIRYLEERVYHEGNELENIDPYSLILDPHSTLKNYQKAEFMGYWRRTNSMNLLKDERDPENRIFNVKYVHKLAEQANGQSATQWMQQSGRFDRSGEVTSSDVPGHPDVATTHGTDVAHLFWNLIPSDWGLGDSDIPECWAFAVAADEVIIQAYNIDYDHGMIPMVLDGPQTCGYDLLPVSSIAATYGIHQFIDWKVRIHYWNASRVQNSMFVVDGSAVNVQDFKNGGPRQIIRLKRQLYGEETIDKFIRQLQVNDVTNDYPAHVQSMMQFNDYCLGTHAITQGDMSGMPDRPTQWGLQAAQQAALSRLSKECQMITEQSYYKLVQMQCHNNVQFLENEQVVKIIGSRYEEQLRQELGLPPEQDDMTVSPWDLDMDSFEIMTLNRMQKEADLMVMEKTLDRILAVPEIAMEAFSGIDVQRFFLAAVRKMGFPNVHEYKRAGGQMPGMNGQVMPDQQVEQQVQAGNLVPAGAVMQ